MKRYGQTAWWLLLHVRDRLKEEPKRVAFPPVPPYLRRRMQAAERLISEGIFREVQRDTEGRLFFTTDLDTVLKAIANGTVR